MYTYVVSLIATTLLSPIGKYNPPPVSHHPPHHIAHPLICAIRDSTVAVKKVAQNHGVLTSYYS